MDSNLVSKILGITHKISSGKDLLNYAESQLELSRGSSEEDDLNNVELGRLNWSPKVNWLEREGGLPKYIEDVAIGIMKSTGYPRERAIPIAINRIKVWATGKGVNADTQARAISALISWEKLKAKAAARRAKNAVK